MSKSVSRKITIPALFEKKRKREKITAITAYDFPTARVVDQAGIDVVLVGDSVGMVVLGYENTIPVTMDEMIHHTRAVRRGIENALLVGDMPYFSYHLSVEETIRNASRFLKEGGAGAVKIEGASPKKLELIRALVEAEIPVMGHVGLTPQSICHLGSFKVQGKDVEDAREIIKGAMDIQSAGAFALILECIPLELAGVISPKLRIPTIGIGAGPGCDGQILVFHDMAGFSNGYLPKFVKRYAEMHTVLSSAVGEYIRDVKKSTFPEDRHSYHLKISSLAQDAWKSLLEEDSEINDFPTDGKKI